MHAKYAGWVPTSSGNLSFTVFGNTAHPNKANFANIECAGRRYILVEQSRFLGDVTIPSLPFGLHDRIGEFLAWHLKKLRTRFAFVFHGRTDEPQGDANTHLRGKVYIFWENGHYKGNTRKHIYSAIERMKQALENGPPGAETARQAYCDITDDLENAAAVVDVCLNRDGVCLVDDFRAGNNAATPLIVESPEESATDSIQERYWTVAAQSFYYVKDLAHRHRHHHSRTDTICDLYRYYEDSQDLSEPDGQTPEDWRNLTLYSMHRATIRLQRALPHKAYERGDGLIAYAESFRKICESRAPAGRPPPFPYSNIAEIRQSLAAANREYEHRISYGQHKQTMLFNILIGILILISTSLAVAGNQSDDAVAEVFDPIMVRMAHWVLGNLTYVIGGVVIGVIALFNFWPPGASVDRPHFRDIMRTFHAWKQGWHAGVLIVAALAILRIVYLMA